jgi:[1-hydroxy-2-(trimethylamino)ethyl]phosphonate dioxygenase
MQLICGKNSIQAVGRSDTIMTHSAFVNKLADLFGTRGAEQYGGEAVTQLQHGLQAAHFAEQSAATPELITAALLHDVGHLIHGLGEDCFEQGQNDDHEELGYRFLRSHLSEAVTEPVRLHVPAKRYLCATEPGYREKLSPQSELSLQIQGGPMSAEEVKQFAANPHCQAAVTLRRWDELAKDPHLETKPFEYFRKYIEQVLPPEPGA